MFFLVSFVGKKRKKEAKKKKKQEKWVFPNPG